MNRNALNFAIASASAMALLITGCSSDSLFSGKAGAFTSVRPVLESNCIHCHGDARLPNMPAFNDTRALARLIGPSNWIVPGHPERSRFFQVVTFSDEQPGAMPPTGHAISKADAKKIRAWIHGGAVLPDGANIKLIPRGEGPRSR